MRELCRHGQIRFFAVSALVATGLLCASLLSVATPTAFASSSQPSSSLPLVMESSSQAFVTDNFNPFVASSVDSQLGVTSLIYETLLQFDTAKPTSAPYDFLATGYRWGPAGKSVTFSVRTNVEFSNGTLMTPADVAFSYDLVRRYPDINPAALPITGVTTAGSDVTVSFSSPEYTNLANIVDVYIVPQSIWSLVGDPGSYIVTDPVGTGPYVLDPDHFAPTGFFLQANPLYWGGPWNLTKGAPKVSSIEFPALASSDTVLASLAGDQLDWSGNAINGLQQAFLAGHADHKVWFTPVSTVTLVPNLTTWPTNQLPVREAISLAINRGAVSADGESGYEPPATNPSGLTLPDFSALESPSVAKLGLIQNLKQAKAVLLAAGYRQNTAGWFEKSGKVVSLNVTDPATSDGYAKDDSIIVSELKAAGIDATFVGQSVASWATDLADGTFELTLQPGESSLSAYQVYNDWLDSSLYSANPKSATGDFERLYSPAVNADLARLANATTISAEKADLAPIEQYMATQLPVIPVLYATTFDEYNTSEFTGWPSASDPYESGSPTAPTNEVVVLHLAPVG